MTATPRAIAMRRLPEADLDRMRELTNIGAGHAATALGQLLGRTCEMQVPSVEPLRANRRRAPLLASARDEAWQDMSGVFFEVEGDAEDAEPGFGGVVALLLRGEDRERLVEALLGRPSYECDPELAASAIGEVANILVSHVVSAMAETLGTVIRPSVPAFVPREAGTELARMVGARDAGGATLCVDTEIADRDRTFRGLLVFVPDARCVPTH